MIFVSRFRCSVCNFIYEEEKEGKNFTDLPNSWTCSVCGALKTAFLLEGFSKGDEGIEKNVTERISNKKLIRKK